MRERAFLSHESNRKADGLRGTRCSKGAGPAEKLWAGAGAESSSPPNVWSRYCSGKPALTSGRAVVRPPGFRDPLSLPPLQSWSPSIARCIYLHSPPLIQTFSSTDSEHWAQGPGAQPCFRQPCFRQPVSCSSKVSRLHS